ncbi:MAG: ABC transporter permease [Gemmatimonadetes bacterium]|nr:ABC transporter permease [Gemmatimonadota bacterium]
MYRNLRLAARSLRRAPAFTIIAALTLALGIGANAVVFSLVNALLFRSLPVEDAGTLVRIGRTVGGDGFLPFSYAEYVELRDGVPAFSGVVAHQMNRAILRVGDEPASEMIEVVSANYFTALGVRPLAGRGFAAEEERVPGAHPVVVISHGLWRSRFGRSPDVVGRAVGLNGHPFTVVGVAPAGFAGTFAGIRVDLWAPVSMLAQAMPGSGALDVRTDRFLMLIGRLSSGGSRESAQDQLDAQLARWSVAHPEPADGGAESGIAIRDASGVHPAIAGLITAFLALLMGMVGIVLMIACANVAGLALARMLERRRELSVRAALGASRWMLVRPILLEGLMVALLGGGVGLLLAGWLTEVLSAFRPDIGLPLALDAGIDARVVVFTLVITVSTGLLFSLFPALRLAHGGVAAELQETAQGGGPSRSRLRATLVVSQVALSALLLFGAALLLQSLRNVREFDPGFDHEGVRVATADPSLLGYDAERGRVFWTALRDRAARLPGVRNAALALMVPLGDRADELLMRPDVADPEGAVSEQYEIVSPGWFDALRIPLVAGRDFGVQDIDAGEDVALVSQAMARRFWGEADGLGRRVHVIDRAGRERAVTIVGITRDFEYRSVGEAPRPVLFLPFSQWYRPDMVLHVRIAGDAAGPLALLRAEFRALEPDLPVDIAALDEEIRFSLIPLRVAGSVLGFAGAAGLALATLGVFGMVAWSAARRVREIAIRVALGARRADLRWMIVRGGLAMTGLGLSIGLAAAALLSQLVRGLLHGVSPIDAPTLAGVILLFLGISAAAAFFPARRASALDPARVLRNE